MRLKVFRIGTLFVLASMFVAGGVPNRYTRSERRDQGRPQLHRQTTYEAPLHANCDDAAARAHSRTFSTLDEFETAVKERSLAELVALWNSLAATPRFADLKPVAKFTDRKTAIRRSWAAIQRLDLPTVEQPPIPESISHPEDTARSTVGRGKKAAAILELLRRPEGATAEEIGAAVNWQRHSIRGFISGTLVKRMGMSIETATRESGHRVYRVKA
jgi:Protein of unknown function (DUF3489)